MAYQALYRAYRPQTFDKVVGQDAVVQTLQNAIINQKITHAYLFCGPRGTGKTSVARIFAKALNCAEVQKNGEPCDECVSCKEISEGISPDVIEIDAASNNGVDEIRDIRERVKFLPSGAKHKIYIIDEVHMLSTGAFNALLKILEEPPKHVIFILATTEPQKIPATIISRCQRFEFKPINVRDISANLKAICANEGVEISDEAIELIGEVADGGMRDALSILDQTISYGSKTISIDDVNTITGSINAETMCNLMSYVDSKDTNNALELISNMLLEGKEVNKIVNGMLLFCRDLMLYKSVGEKKLNKYIFDREKFKALALKIPSTKIIYYIEILCDIQNRVKYTNSPAIYLEIAVIRMTSVSNEELDIIKRMDELETKFIDNSFAQEGFSGEMVDGASLEKVNTLETRINKLVGELSKYELPSLSRKVNDIEQIVAEKINQDEIEASNDNTKSKLLELESEYASKFVDLEAKINALENGKVLIQSDTSSEAPSMNNINDKMMVDEINTSIDSMKQELSLLKQDFATISGRGNKDTNEELDTLKLTMDQIKNKFDGLFNRVEAIERKNDENNNQTILVQDNQLDDNAKTEVYQIKSELVALKNELKNRSTSIDETSFQNQYKTLENKISEMEAYSEMVQKDLEEKIEASALKQNEIIKNSTLDKDELNKVKETVDANLEAINTKLQEAMLAKENETSENGEAKISLAQYNKLEEIVYELSKEIYELKAEKLAPKEKTKATKKPIGQMNIFEFGVEKLDEFGCDFDELEKDESKGEKISEKKAPEDKKNNSESLSKEDSKKQEPINDNVNETIQVEQPSVIMTEENETLPENPLEESSGETIEEQKEASSPSSEELIKENEKKQILSWNAFIDSTKPSLNNDFEFKPNEEASNREEIKLEKDTKTPSIDMNDSLLKDALVNDDSFELKCENDAYSCEDETKVNSEATQNEETINEPVEEKSSNKEIISEYYDEKNGVQVINKTNSSILIKEESKKEDNKLDESNQENNIKDSKVEQSEIITHEEKTGNDKFALYNIKDLEQILFDAHDPECRNEKARITSLWKTLLKSADPSLYSTAQLLSESDIVAVGNKEIVITYDTINKCNEVMRWSFKQKALKLLYNRLGAQYNYLALPKETWLEKKEEYKSGYQNGNKYVKLKPYEIPGLNVNELLSDSDDEKNEKIDQTRKIFGSDIVTIK